MENSSKHDQYEFIKKEVLDKILQELNCEKFDQYFDDGECQGWDIIFTDPGDNVKVFSKELIHLCYLHNLEINISSAIDDDSNSILIQFYYSYHVD